MKLWLLDRLSTDRSKVYDCHNGHVIAAPDEATAREMASECAGDEGKSCWLTPSMSTCVHIGESIYDASTIVISDFHAG